MAKAQGSRSQSKTKKASDRAPKLGADNSSGSPAVNGSAPPAITPEERYRIVAEAAYLRAEQRGFLGGDPVRDWLEAEAEVAMRLHAYSGEAS